MSIQNSLVGLVCVVGIAVISLVAFNASIPEHDCLLESKVTEIVQTRSKSIIWKSHELIFETGRNVKLGDVVCLIFNGNDDFRLSEQIYVNPAVQNPSVLTEKLEGYRASIN